MSDTDTGAGAGAGEHALVKTEAALPAPPPGLIPIARDPAAAAATAASLSAEKQQVGHIYNCRLGLPGATEPAETTDENEHYWDDCKPEKIPIYGNSKIVRPSVLLPFSQIIRGFSTDKEQMKS